MIRLYECAAGAEFEREERVNDNPLSLCPLCGKCAPKRLINGAPGVLFMTSPMDCSGWADSGYSKHPNKRKLDAKLGRR